MANEQAFWASHFDNCFLDNTNTILGIKLRTDMLRSEGECDSNGTSYREPSDSDVVHVQGLAHVLIKVRAFD